MCEVKLKELEKMEEPLQTEIILRLRQVCADLHFGKIKIREEYEARLDELQGSGSRFANFFST